MERHKVLDWMVAGIPCSISACMQFRFVSITFKGIITYIVVILSCILFTTWTHA